jgi:hypothetical protein
MISIKSFSKPKNVNGNSVRYIGGNGFAGNSTINVGGNASSVNGVYLWGQWHDHTQDINGDLTSNGTIQANNLVALNNVNTYTANVQGKLTAGEVETPYVSATTIDTNTIIGELGKFTTLSATTLSAITAFITTLNSTNITTDYLTVTKAAHFFKLIIDEIKATKGQIIITPSNATIDKVTALSNGNYRCYFRAKDGEGREIYQSFEINDQVVCQTFNAATGTSYNVSNKYYWRKVVNVSTATTNQTIDGVSYPCHWIDISATDKDPQCTDIPAKGDEIVQLGNRTDTTRQAAITIGAYNNPYLDTGITAPFIIQYAGINDYNLSTHRVNVISNGYNSFKGAFMTNNGDDVETLIHEVSSGATTYVHQAWSNSADGRLNFSKTYFDDALYVGFCSNWTESDTALVYTDYTWARLKGEDGQDGSGSTFVKLSPLVEEVYIDRNDFCVINIAYNIVKQEGTTISTLTASTSNYYVRFRPYKLNGSGATVNLSTGVTPSYLNYEYQNDWSDRNDALQYLQVELVKGSTIYDKRIVNAILSPSASLEITDSIITRVQGNEQSISSNTNAISSLNQQYNSINATVTAHTAQISNLDQDVYELSTDVSNLEIRADGISSMVSKYSGVQLINAFGWTKTDGTAASYNEDTQSYSLVYPSTGSDCSIYSNVVKLDAGKEYVFSCYPSIPNPPITVYYSATNKAPTEFSTTVSTVLTKYTDDIYHRNQRYGYKFTATDSGYYVIKFGVSTPVNDAFYRPQLELGTAPTEFDRNSVMLSSEIVQNATNILLQVAGCGVNIDSQQITLRGDTEIIGNLTLTRSDQGFVLQGDGGTTIISPQSIGTYNQFTQKTSVDNYVSTINHTEIYPQGGAYRCFTSFTKNLGHIKQGTILTFKNQNIQLYNAHTQLISGAYAEEVNYTITQGSNNTYFTNTNMQQTTIGTYTAPSDGNVIVLVTASILVDTAPSYWQDGVNPSLRYVVNIPNQNAFCLIGYDGIGINYSNNRTIYIGEEGTTFKYNNGGLRINDNGVYKLNPNDNTTFVPLSTQKVTTLSGNYTLQSDDEFLFTSNLSGDIVLTLPSSTYKGRKIYIKNATTHNVNVVCNGRILRSDKGVNAVADSMSVNAQPRAYLYTGYYWCELFGG